MSVTPSDAELENAVLAIKNENPDFGVRRIHGLIKQQYPSWSLSEKKLQTFMKARGLTADQVTRQSSMTSRPSLDPDSVLKSFLIP